MQIRLRMAILGKVARIPVVLCDGSRACAVTCRDFMLCSTSNEIAGCRFFGDAREC